MGNSLKNIKDIIYKLVYVLSKEHKRLGVLVLTLSFIGALLETLGVSAILPLINALMTPEVILENPLAGPILRTFQVTEKGEIILVVGGGIILLYLFKNIYFIFLAWVRAKYSCKVRRELSVNMMKSYMDRGYRFFLNINTSELLRGVSADTNAVYNLLSQLFKNIVDCMTVVMICIFVLITDWVMAAGIVVLAGLCLVIIYGGFRTKMRILGVEYRKYNKQVNQQAIQAFQGIKEVIVMRKQKFFIQRFEDASIKQQQTFVGHTVGSESPAYIIEAVCITGLLGIICVRLAFGGGEAADMLPSLSAFAVGAFRILPALGKISSGLNSITFYVPSLNDMYEQFKIMQENAKEESAIREIDTGVTEFKHELQVKDICWKYNENANYVLKDLCLTVPRGDSIAFIGQSGAGKTTLADIILGLLKPQKGSVTIDGKDIFAIGTEWNRIMGYVPQSVYITDDTIRRNIAFGVPEEEINDAKVWKALEQAQLKDFVKSLDKQLDTMVGERGVRFSGGQRQRVAIARALYEEPCILILDEATAALDNETEKAVMEAIENLQGKITLIIVAHRLTTVRKCDRIYEIKDGSISECDKAEIFKEI